MLPSSRPSSSARFACVLLSYVLLVTLLAPLPRSAASRAAAGAAPRNQSEQSGPQRPAEVLVRFRPEVSDSMKDALASARGARRGRPLRGASRFERLEITGGQTPLMLAQQLADQPSVEWVEPNYLVSRAEVTPDDARFNEQWALRNSGDAGGRAGADIAAPEAWERTTGSTGTIVAVIDSGVDFTHPDLARNRWANPAERANGRDDDRDGYTDDFHGWDWVAGDNRIRDEQGHGTSVAGIIAAEGNNALGTTGVMWRASLMSLRVLDATGTGDVAGAVEAIDYAVAHGAQVINLSWGLETGSVALREAIERASFRGAVVVCSAGNNGRNIDNQPYYPASYDLPNIVSVAATDSSDNLASWSNWGATRVTVGAPGVNILTTRMGGDYHAVTGTSAAAPLVTGIAGLIRTAYPWLSAADIRASILSGARQAGGLSGKVASGGVAQASDALGKAGGMGGGSGVGNGTGSGNNGAGGHNAGGNGQGHGPSSRPGSRGQGSGGGGPGGSFDAPASAPTKNAPPNFQNQDEVRRRGAVDPQARPFIQSNSLPFCDGDCESYSVGGAGGSDPYFGRARSLPANRTGAQEGVDLGSRNFNWNTPLVSLAGRAGLDLNLALYYNSLVWTRQDNTIQYNADHGFPGPGFHLGFPTLQPRHYNSNTGTYSYTMVTSSGGRVEMGQLGGSNTYESIDGSYTQLVEYYQIVARHDGKCLDISGVNQNNGAPLHQWDCHNVPNQQWQLVPTDSGYYKIISRYSAKTMDVATIGHNNGDIVHQWEYVGGANQQWQIVPTGDGYYRITARHSGKSLDVAGGSYANGGGIHQWDYVGAWNQQWQLVPVPGQAVVRRTDGTQLTFAYYPGASEYRCTEIKDRNGNYITINYGPINNDPSLGRPTSVVDTLGRAVNFNYNTQGYLESITQAWTRETPDGVVSETHEWAHFHYGTVVLQPSFPGLNVLAPTGTNVPVLARVDLQDKSSYQFEYEAGWGMVKRISHYGPDPVSRLINYTSYDIPAGGTSQTDCPRVKERRDWAIDWNNNQEAVTTYAVTENATWTTDNAIQTGTRMKVTSPVFYDKLGQPKQVVENVYSFATGWAAGLPIQTETYERAANGAETLQRTVVNGWTRDNSDPHYAVNPRPWELRVSDPDGHFKRTTMTYTSYGLPEDVYEYASDGTTVLRRTQTHYYFNPAHVHRHIIGLTAARYVYDGGGALMSKVAYHYDSGGGSSQWLDDMGQVTQHDRAYYGKSYDIGRGNLCWVQRFDVNDPNNAGNTAVTSGTGYNITGSAIWQTDPSGHINAWIGYADSFSTAGAPLTYAYPTIVYDGDNFYSTMQYNYSLGAVYLTTDPKGASRKMQYDKAGRVLRTTNMVDGSYTRYEYDPNWGHTRSYTPNEVGELYTNTITDGAGNVFLSLANNAHSAGNYMATLTKYDALGRAVAATNPTEITGAGVPAGDDAAGFRWTSQAYDWKGRPTLTTFPAVGGQPLGNTKELTYGGCGCAGGEVTTYRDESGRRRVFSKDVLGRLAKVEEMNWLDSQGVYSTTNYAYNARDQITQINHASQTRTLEYDGHGRLWRRTTPEQKQTTYSYNADDTLQATTDARGVTTSLVYNNRHLLTNINYTFASNSTATLTSNVTFEYDAAGNRTARYNGVELRQYQYDQLSRLTRESINIPGLNPNWYQLKYDYNQAGQLTRFTNPWDVQVAYGYDPQGRVTDVRGTDANGAPTYDNVPNYAVNLRYRAFGGMKEMSYGNGKSLAVAYDERLRLKKWNVAGTLGWDYYYDHFREKSHRVTYAVNISNVDNLVQGPDPRLNRSYDYDQVGRLWEAHSGNEADAHVAGQPFPAQPDGPYSHSYRYDQTGNMTYRVGWGGMFGNYVNQTFSFTGNRMNGIVYDEAGNMTYDGGHYAYDATGQQTDASQYPVGWGGYANYSLQQAYDGDGLRVRKVDNGTPTYYLRSSVLGGQVVAELNWQGNWARGYVYLGGQLLAIQSGGVKWVHQDPVVKSQRLTDKQGTLQAVVELDAWGGETSRSWQQWQQSHRFTSYERDGNGNDQAMFRNYHGGWMRFDQPDPYEGSYDLTDPQSLNRYAYVNNDPVNFIDPSGLNAKSSGVESTCYLTLTVNYSIDGEAIFYSISGWELHCYGGNSGGGGTSTDGGGSGGQQPGKQPEKKSCNVDFFDDHLQYYGPKGQLFSGADLNIAARAVYGEAAGSDQGGTFAERQAVASVLYNRIGESGFRGGIADSFGLVAFAPAQFEAVTGTARQTQKFRNSARGSYQNLEAKECKDLRDSVAAIRDLITSGSKYQYRYNLGGKKGSGDVIGGSRFFINRVF